MLIIKATHNFICNQYIKGIKGVYQKAVATINHPIDKDLPMVIVEDEIEKLADEFVTKYGKRTIEKDGLLATGFAYGYKARHQKGVYSEEDLIAFGKSCFYKGYDKSENDGRGPKD